MCLLISSKTSFLTFIVYLFDASNMDINNYVFINKKVLKFVGLYPTSIVRYILCCICMIAIVIPQGLQIYENWQDFSTVLETRYLCAQFPIIDTNWIVILQFDYALQKIEVILFLLLSLYSSVLLTILLAILKSLVWISNRRKMDPFIEYMLTDYWNILTTNVSKNHTDVYAM